MAYSEIIGNCGIHKTEHYPEPPQLCVALMAKHNLFSFILKSPNTVFQNKAHAANTDCKSVAANWNTTTFYVEESSLWMCCPCERLIKWTHLRVIHVIIYFQAFYCNLQSFIYPGPIPTTDIKIKYLCNPICIYHL